MILMKRKLTFALHPKTGFIKRPRVSEIVGSGSSPGQALTLGCEITDFYPPNVTVTWLMLREGEQDDGEQEVLEGGEVWGPVQTHPRVYRATATLRRHATGRQRKPRGGGGIVCRVEHCSLLEPLEKHWRNVDLGTSLYGHVKMSFYNAEDFPTRFNPLGKSLAFSSFSFTPSFRLFSFSCSLHSSLHLGLLEQRRGRCVLPPVEGGSPQGQIAVGGGRTHALPVGLRRDGGDRR